MATNVEIANIAMTLLGEDTIVSLTSDLGEKERKVNAIYTTTRDEVLRSFPWNFATKQATLGLLSETPTYEWTYMYQLPSDFIRLLMTEGQTKYRIQGDKLLSNQATLNITYTFRETDPQKWDTCFVNAFAAKIAFKLAYALPNSNSLQATAKAYYDEAIAEARGLDSQENEHEPLYYDELTDARLGTFSRNTGYEGSVTT